MHRLSVTIVVTALNPEVPGDAFVLLTEDGKLPSMEVTKDMTSKWAAATLLSDATDIKARLSTQDEGWVDLVLADVVEWAYDVNIWYGVMIPERVTAADSNIKWERLAQIAKSHPGLMAQVTKVINKL